MIFKIIQPLIKIKKYIWNVLKIDPIGKVFKFIDKKIGGGYDVLELFGGTGKLNTIYYQNNKSIKSLTLFEILSENCDELKKNCPNAIIKNVDTFKEIENCKEKFDIIICDNTPTIFGDYCEHFEIFPKIFGVSKEKFAVVVNIIMNEKDISKSFKVTYPTLFKQDHLNRRKEFYRVDNPTKIDIDSAIRAYKKIGKINGYTLEDYMLVKRGKFTFVYFLTLIFVKSK